MKYVKEHFAPCKDRIYPEILYLVYLSKDRLVILIAPKVEDISLSLN